MAIDERRGDLKNSLTALEELLALFFSLAIALSDS